MRSLLGSALRASAFIICLGLVSAALGTGLLYFDPALATSGCKLFGVCSRIDASLPPSANDTKLRATIHFTDEVSDYSLPISTTGYEFPTPLGYGNFNYSIAGSDGRTLGTGWGIRTHCCAPVAITVSCDLDAPCTLAIAERWGSRSVVECIIDRWKPNQ